MPSVHLKNTSAPPNVIVSRDTAIETLISKADSIALRLYYLTRAIEELSSHNDSATVNTLPAINGTLEVVVEYTGILQDVLEELRKCFDEGRPQ